ncbi:beta-1,4-galactosyltransferase 1 isoform X2 [Gouania willdenowi]|uniref:Beta-1,4-galactosyltransferase n=1 Tax=Gouania willdenowi TaxID=441366 RepID=A0A8C5NAQ7_GOUWI|nr:beta-1,4-galactosyltransferase 1-like isoform X2 [Gouania willdenowi]
MPATSTGSFTLLHRFCALVVLLTFVHISVSLVFYVCSTDVSTAFLSIPKNPNRTVATEQLRSAEDHLGKELELQQCPDTSPLLVGPLTVEFGVEVTLQQVKEKNPDVMEGGWRPSDCVSVQRVAILIPFRHRDEHLKLWLHYMHPILQRQQLDYRVYIINQAGERRFNRAKLLNVGFTEALKDYDYNCFVFSDVDIIPLDDRNIYGCFDQPRHLSVSMDKFRFRLPYKQYFGGVSSLSKEQFLKINGFPNNYWGWGGEDDDIYNRCVFKGMTISRPSAQIGRCRMIKHKRDAKNDANPRRHSQITHTRETMETDGINSLTYKVVDIKKLQLFTNITVDVGQP